MKSAEANLAHYRAKLDAAVARLGQARMDGKYDQIPALKEAVRTANENLRIFKYKAKPCLTPNGHLLRP